MFCSQLYCNIFGAGHSMSEIHLKLMLVQMMPASSPVGLFLLHPLNPTEIQQWEQDQTFPCMCMNKSIGMSKCVCPSWAMKHGLPGQKRGGKGAVLDTIIDSSSGRKQSSCGRHQLVGLHLYSHPLCLFLWAQVLLTRYSKCRQGQSFFS